MIENIELLKKAQAGDAQAMESMLGQYKSLVATIGRKYYLMGGDGEDLIQEGMIGLYKAVRTYDESKGSTFNTYASRLIEREMISAIRRTTGQQILTEAVELDNSVAVGDSTPEGEYIDQESVAALLREIDEHLSELEKVVVREYLKGYNYIDIASKLGKSPKSIDNALTRIKNKLKFLKDRL